MLRLFSEALLINQQGLAHCSLEAEADAVEQCTLQKVKCSLSKQLREATLAVFSDQC